MKKEEKEKIITIMRNNTILCDILPRILRFYNPHLSYCSKCKLPWNWCNSKSVMYSKHSGTFATCDYCWDNSTLEELKKYYTEVYKMQEKQASLDHTLEHLLKSVEKEFYYTRKYG